MGKGTPGAVNKTLRESMTEEVYTMLTVSAEGFIAEDGDLDYELINPYFTSMLEKVQFGLKHDEKNNPLTLEKGVGEMTPSKFAGREDAFNKYLNHVKVLLESYFSDRPYTITLIEEGKRDADKVHEHTLLAFFYSLKDKTPLIKQYIETK